MSQYLAYWKYKNASCTHESYDGKLMHAVSSQYSKIKNGDVVWIVTSKSDIFYLLGPILVSEITDTPEAEKRLNRYDLYEADYHIFPVEGSPADMKWIEVTLGLPKLRFSETKKDRLLNGWSARNLQTIRKLTDASGTMLQQIYDEG